MYKSVKMLKIKILPKNPQKLAENLEKNKSALQFIPQNVQKCPKILEIRIIVGKYPKIGRNLVK